MTFLLGIDVGTTNWKAAIFNEQGELIAISETSALTHYDEQGRGSYDPDELWVSVAGVIKNVLLKVGKPKKISAVSVTSIAESGVPVDQNGDPTYPIIAWFDSRSIPQSQFLEQQLGKEKIFQITGLDNNPIFSISKLMWIREHEPEAFARTQKWLCITDFIYWKLAGVYATDYTIASRTLALDLSRNNWSGEILEAAGLNASLFPDIYPSGTVIGRVTKKAATEIGIPEGTPVVVGGHDHLCGSLAAGILLGQRVLDSSGTAESIVGISEPDANIPRKFEGLRIGRYIDPRRFATWGGVIASGSSVDWAMGRFASLSGWGLEKMNAAKLDYAEVMEAARKTPAGARGLIYLPHLRGCGAPYWNPRSRGAFLGLRSTHSQPELIRAVIEGLCFEIRLILELMETISGRRFEALNTIGGGARNYFWQQTKADITGKTVEVPNVEEATAMGAALLAGIGIGVYRDMIDASQRTYRVKMRYQPNPEVKETYDQYFNLYKQVYPTLTQLNNDLDSLNG